MTTPTWNVHNFFEPDSIATHPAREALNPPTGLTHDQINHFQAYLITGHAWSKAALNGTLTPHDHTTRPARNTLPKIGLVILGLALADNAHLHNLGIAIASITSLLIVVSFLRHHQDTDTTFDPAEIILYEHPTDGEDWPSIIHQHTRRASLVSDSNHRHQMVAMTLNNTKCIQQCIQNNNLTAEHKQVSVVALLDLLDKNLRRVGA